MRSRPITSIACQHQLWLYGHVARYLEADPASQVVSKGDNLGWRRCLAHKVRGWGKLMFPAGSYLVWEGGLHGAIPGAGVGRLAR